MPEEQLQAFLEKVKADTILQEKLKAAATADAVAAIAKEAGFSISADELSHQSKTPLSEDDLEKVSGGATVSFCGKCWSAILSNCDICNKQ